MPASFAAEHLPVPEIVADRLRPPVIACFPDLELSNFNNLVLISFCLARGARALRGEARATRAAAAQYSNSSRGLPMASRRPFSLSDDPRCPDLCEPEGRRSTEAVMIAHLSNPDGYRIEGYTVRAKRELSWRG